MSKNEVDDNVLNLPVRYHDPPARNVLHLSQTGPLTTQLRDDRVGGFRA